MRILPTLIASALLFCGTAVATPFAVMFGGTPYGNQQLILTIDGTQSVTLNSTYTGWWGTTMSHDPQNYNYAVGFGVVDGFDAGTVNDFFVFDLYGISGNISNAYLSIGNPPAGPQGLGGYHSPDPTEQFLMHDVTTPIDKLTLGSGIDLDILTDLGSGVLFASRSVSIADNDTQVIINLNSDAISSLNSAKGDSWAIGGMLVNDTAVPEPTSLLLLGTGLGVIGLAAWRRRK